MVAAGQGADLVGAAGVVTIASFQHPAQSFLGPARSQLGLEVDGVQQGIGQIGHGLGAGQLPLPRRPQADLLVGPHLASPHGLQVLDQAGDPLVFCHHATCIAPQESTCMI